MATRQGALTCLLVVLGAWTILVDCQQQNCGIQIECGLCISQPDCAWCADEGFIGVRCQPAANLTNCVAIENPQDSMPSSVCGGNGVRRCGVCECFPGWCGSDCSQNIGDRSATECPRGGVDNLRCSGPERGECMCTCICTPPPPENPGRMIFGNACQCDNFNCALDDDGNVCSGRGMCCDGRCICGTSSNNNTYRGLEGSINNCQCEPLEEVCRDPENGLLCNDRGTCGCNFCMCNDTSFAGTFCDVPNNDSCNFIEDQECIDTCRAEYQNEEDLPNRCTLCNLKRPLLFVSLDEVNEADSLTEFLETTALNRLGMGGRFSFVRGACEYTNGDNCVTEYYILMNETNFAIVAVRELDCNSPFALLIPVWALAPIILGCLLILGILIVILIKIIFTILDYVDFKRWQRDAQGADFSKNTNPLYQSPEMKYENVAYGKE